MKKVLVLLAAAALLVMGVSSAWATPAVPGVGFDDRNETGVAANPLNGANVTFDTPTYPNSETAQITGTWNVAASGTILPSGTTVVFLLGTGASGDNGQWTSASGVTVSNISDFIILNMDADPPASQTFTIYFESDNPDFQTHLTALVPVGTPYNTTPEDGNFHDLAGLLGLPTETFVINVASDAPEVPLPGALLLLGGGLVRLVVHGRRQRQAMA